MDADQHEQDMAANGIWQRLAMAGCTQRRATRVLTPSRTVHRVEIWQAGQLVASANDESAARALELALIRAAPRVRYCQ